MKLNNSENTNGTQVTDIEKKEDYPKFKVGKKITNLVTTEEGELSPAEVAEQHPDNHSEYVVKCKNNHLVTIFEEYFSTEKEAFDYAEGAIKAGDFERLDIYAPDGSFIAGVVKSMINDSELEESYNYIGTDTGDKGNHDNTHKEKIYIVYDKYGEIGEYHTREEAQEVIDEWYIDPELYKDKEDADLHIEEDVIDVFNDKIVVKDDLAS